MCDGCFVCLTGPFHAQHGDMDWAAYEPGLHAQLKEIKSLQEPEQSLAFVLSQGAGLAVLDNGPQVPTFAEDGCVAAFTGCDTGLVSYLLCLIKGGQCEGAYCFTCACNSSPVTAGK